MQVHDAWLCIFYVLRKKLGQLESVGTTRLFGSLRPTFPAMFSIQDIRLAALSTHYVGNGAAGDVLETSGAPVELDSEGLKAALLQFFLAPFREAPTFNLYHPTGDLALNEVAHFVGQIFADPATLHTQSVRLAQHLYDITALPQIKSGELHVAHFTGCPVDGRVVNAVGIYKTESRNHYLKITGDGRAGFHFQTDEGLDPDRMDKGCVIFNIGAEQGYRVHVVDRTSKGGSGEGGAQFWKDTFLKVRAAADDYHATEDFMQMSKLYIEKGLPQEFKVDRTQQLAMLSKTAGYFKGADAFQRAEFEQHVFPDTNVRDSFRQYEKQYTADRELRFDDGFGINEAAVKKAARGMKSILKLDKNFHVYIHGNRDMIERGYDEETGLHFYKLYFEEES